MPSPTTARCTWAEDVNGDYDTDCGHTFLADDSDEAPRERGFRYCAFCGRTLKQFRFLELDAEDDAEDDA